MIGLKNKHIVRQGEKLQKVFGWTAFCIVADIESICIKANAEKHDCWHEYRIDSNVG
jgi:hypothetical protein